VIDNIELFFAEKCTYQSSINILNLPSDSKQLSTAAFPVFDGMVDPRLRALVAVALGCDVILYAAMTPSSMLCVLKQSPEILQSNPSDAYFILKKHIVGIWNKNNKKKKKDDNNKIVCE
jgi:hypothetical protein